MSDTALSPQRSSSCPSKVRVGSVWRMFSKSKSLKQYWKNSPTSPISGARRIISASRSGGVVGEFVRRGQRRDDLRVGDEFVAVAVVAVGVGVDERADVVGRGLGGAHGLEHIRRERHVEQGIDQQRLALRDDQSGVAPAPAAIGLDPGVTAGSEVVQTALERPDSQRHRTSRAVPEAWDGHG